MRPITRREFIILAGGLAGAPAAFAQSAYPNKPVRIITPYPPGGPTEILSRLLGAKLQERLGQPFVIEARAGAGGNVGTDYVAKSPGDGYNLLMGASGPLAINVTLYRNLPYDPTRDLAAVDLVASVPLVLVVNAAFPAKNLAELMDLLKAKPEA